MRDFRLYTEPSIADPEHEIQVTELVKGQFVQYNSPDVVLDAVLKLRDTVAYNKGWAEGVRWAKEHAESVPDLTK